MKKTTIILLGVVTLILVSFFVYSKLIQPDKIETKTEQKQENAVLSDSQLKDEIGQMILVGFRGTEFLTGSDVEYLVKEVKVGGLLFSDYDVYEKKFSRNIVNYEQTKKLISDTQKNSDTPLFIAVDAEGGDVNRLKEKYGFLPVVSAKKMGEDKTLQTTYEESISLATELRAAGFNINFAPVVDVNYNPKNPIIGASGRSFSNNPEDVYKNAKVFIENHQKGNIIAVAKHFPGQGGASTDTHLGLADITNTYKQEELIPYQKLNKDGLLKAVMVAHTINKNIDENYPASLSEKFIQDILEKQIGFSGVIISDDIQMGAITNNFALEEAVIKAVNSGINIITITNNTEATYNKTISLKIKNIIFDAVKNGEISQQKITDSYNRITALKKEFGIILSNKNSAEKISAIKSRNFELIGQANAVNFEQALKIAEDVSKKVAIRPAFLLAIFQQELKLEKFDMCYLTNFTDGSGVKVADGKKITRVMKPDRDIQDFLSITKKLGKDPLKTQITCPMNFGWGGAMGPADFIPSTWKKYENKIQEITGKSADPWNLNDAFLAAGLYLSDSGANLKTYKGEWSSAMIYFSGSTTSPYTWYADSAIMIADNIQSDIITIKSSTEE